jgi:hypothetical protein
MNLQTSGASCRENAEACIYVVPAQAGTQYSETSVIESKTRGVLDTPPTRSMTILAGQRHAITAPRARPVSPMALPAHFRPMPSPTPRPRGQ